MEGEETMREVPTRRDALKYGGALATGATLAGCSDLVGQGGDAGTETTGTGSYSVSMEPMGTVSFDQV